MINLNKDKKIETSEDVTQYGEAVPSTFQWITMDKLRKRVRELAEIGKKKDNNK